MNVVIKPQTMGSNKPSTTRAAAYKSRLVCLAPAILLGLNLFIFGTLVVFSENRGEFLVSYPDVLKSYFLPLLLVFLTIAVIPLFCFGNQFRLYYNALLLLLATITYVHGNLLLWDTGILDGSELDLSKTWRSIVDGLLWLAFAFVIFRYRHWFSVHGWKICAALVVFQTIGILAFSIEKTDRVDAELEAVPEELFVFSTKGNVIHIILDGFQGSVFESLLETRPDLERDLSGFIFFRDASTVSDITYLSVPALLSGKAFVNDQPISVYRDTALRGHNLYSVLSAAGYDVDVATPLWWNEPNDLFSTYFRIPTPFASEKENIQASALLLGDISLYRHLPHFLKPSVYRSGEWLLATELLEKPEQQYHHFAHNSFLSDITDKATAAPIPPRYKFIHLVTPHAPQVVSAKCKLAGIFPTDSVEAFEHQSGCTLKNVVKFLKVLKTIDVYDSSLIIINSDHGGGVPFDMRDENGELTNSSIALDNMWGNPLPLMLLKPPFSQGAVKTSDKLVALTDIPATVADALHIDGNFPGHSMLEENNSEEAVRYYYRSGIHRNEADAKDYFERFSTFRIDGSIYEVDSWSEADFFAVPITDDANNYRWGTQITFGKRGNSRPFQLGGWGRGAGRRITWTIDTHAALSINFSDVGPAVRMRIDFKPYLNPEKLKSQRVNIFVSDVKVAEFSESIDDFHTIELSIPPELFNPSGKTEIRFELPDARSPASLGAGVDQRDLGIAVRSIEFIRPVDAVSTLETSDQEIHLR